MNKTLKIIIATIILVVISYLSYFFYVTIRYSHSSDKQTYKEYMWVFKDSVKTNLNTNFCYSYVKKRDVYNNFHYKDIYNIIVWEFKDLANVELKKATINQNVNLYDVKFQSGEILNKGSDLEFTINYGFVFNSEINVNLDEYSKIERTFKGTNYKGFYGSINHMSLSNEKGEHQILSDFTKGLTPTVFLFYKGHQSFYIVMINSEKPFDENIIKILNLD
ncbi:hypothetical protein GON26_12550 [Flavobacterium sp. GA093]|uniref:Uncharacterized protein n=1 Tax=Flavobacterium hydrocarbonoxydans TaxID=2683249 RepID=A0A6I4NM91_9FLAO|nr:hypothetical protein [Flavobacterium hydrocarbonoxydans]MWB95193.1 hypothetical protein [Flavobacterium hydrocarbonoxydans]